MDSSIDSLTNELESALLSIDRIKTRALLIEQDLGFTALERVEFLVVPVLTRIGDGWANGDYSLSQVYMSGRICEEFVDIILPPNHDTRTNQPKIGIVTLEDYHLLGKRIVYSTLRASGFEVFNLGRLDHQALAETVIQEEIKILLISALMLPSALKVKNVRELLEEAEAEVKILVGGAPFQFDEALWKEVKADACGKTASEAVALTHKLIEEIA